MGGGKGYVDPAIAAIHKFASAFGDYQEGIRAYWQQPTCGCVKACDPSQLQPGERCVNAEPQPAPHSPLWHMSEEHRAACHECNPGASSPPQPGEL